MQPTGYTRPFYIFFLVLPYGISLGFASVTLPYLLTHSGFTVSTTAAIVALGVSANIWRFIWGPFADLILSLRKWYWMGAVASSLMLLLLSLIHYDPQAAGLLIALVFISQVAATFVVLPVGSIMANRIEIHQKGRAGGWYQAGNLGGTGLGGGAGLWLATHFSIATAGIVLCAVSLLCAGMIQLIQDVQSEKGKTILKEFTAMGKDLLSMVRIPVVLFVLILLLMPIGTGAASNLWSAIAADWKTTADMVALVTGILSGLVSAIGCVAGGFIADRHGVWFAYLGSGGVCALVTIIMAVMPYEPFVYIGGVLAYAFALGLLNAAFSAVVLFAIGKKNAATKYSLLSSLGNIPVVYMTAFDGWTHDRFNSKIMLVAEGALGILFILIFIVILKRMMYKKLIPKAIE
jgi:MFS transporter, PAT family, beta-lactamase induction signal transducer AmpG